MVADLSQHVTPATLGLRDALAAAADLRTTVEVTLDHLRRLPRSMSSLYLARGDRLRCLGQRGRTHVQDGLMMSVGVVGRTFRSGEPVRTLAADSPDYIAEVPGVVEEVCVPIRVGGEVVGVLNVECTQLLPP
nr:GAF domain-containing protein [Geodermatophilaceae bacterium]